MLTKGKPLQQDDSGAGVATDVLLWIAGEPERLMPFLRASGIDPRDLRARAADPTFLDGVLDYVVGDEAVLTACAAGLGLSPERIAAVWRRRQPAPDDP